MGNSYRLRTKVGVDKALNVALEQDFESLEILSLKILQSQIYTRQCSDYGVVVGRVTANNGLGIPNVKVSIFIPLSDEDEQNPTIREIYPYKTLNDLNDEGYRYNLLPYEKSHQGHTPTGTLPSREDVLIIPSLVEVYDKYYKFTTKTNDSGDYMIFGVPLGTQTVHMDVDLSDIGEFSLSPQDMIRLNLANELQVNGTEFKSSTNLGELPQIKQSNRTVEVIPLWGQPEICYLGITRLDFDLSQEFGIRIEPAAIFMGSIMSNIDKEAVKKNCKLRRKLGTLCNLTTGPGEILAIRQTINLDINGRPVLETMAIEEGGKCINDDGTWLIDIPMNLDYVYTDEFGNRQISDDPTVGIPTKAKARFKIKWEQPQTLTNEVLRSAYLVPNIKEWGWLSYDRDPSTLEANFFDELFGGCIPPSQTLFQDANYRAVKASYAFSLDWTDYGEKDLGNNLTSRGLDMVNEAINCEDRFYEMIHSKVYTASQLISEHRGGRDRYKFIGIKNILDETCEGKINKYPANDGMFQSDILYILFSFMMQIFKPILFAILQIRHIVALIVCILAGIVCLLAAIVQGIEDAFCGIANFGILGGYPLRWLFGPLCNLFGNFQDAIQKPCDDLRDKCKNQAFRLPMLTYPDCEMCDCKNPTIEGEDVAGGVAGSEGLSDAADQGGASNFFAPLLQSSAFECGNLTFGRLAVGAPFNVDSPTLQSRAPFILPYEDTALPEPYQLEALVSTSIPHFERLNIFNTKAKYFENSTTNPGGGWNRIRCSFALDIPGNGISKWHLDNVVVLLLKPSVNFQVGQMVTFNDPTLSQDPNLSTVGAGNQFGNNALTGTTYGTPVIDYNDTNVPPGAADDQILYYDIPLSPVDWANTNGVGFSTTYYNLTARTDNQYAKFKMDLEYFQVIHTTTVGEYITKAGSYDTGDPTTLYNRVFMNNMTAFEMTFDTSQTDFIDGNTVFVRAEYGGTGFLHFSCMTEYTTQKLVFLVRGVDPYSTRRRCRFDVSRLYGVNTDFSTTWSTDTDFIIEDDFKLNIPINGGFKCVQHLGQNGNPGVLFGYTPSNYLFHPSFEFNPDPVLFESFTSTATTTYSRLDGIYAGFGGVSTLGGPAPLFSYGVTPSIAPLKVDNSNWMTRDFYSQVDPLLPLSYSNTYFSSVPLPTNDLSDINITNNTLTNGRNKGYFINEIVEGGAYIYLNAGALQPQIYGPAAGIPGLTDGFYYAIYPPDAPITVDSGYLCEPYDPVTQFMTFNNSQRIVMRSDRLPMSSTQLFQTGTSVPPAGGTQSYPLHANNLFAAFQVDDEGLVTASATPPSQGNLGASAENQAALSANPQFANVAESFGCGGLAPLRCYETDPDGFITLKPYDDPATSDLDPDDCYLNLLNIPGTDISINPEEPELIVENGCYVLVTVPILSLPLDVYLLYEWESRIKMNFAACRNVFGHIFTNQWINGNLFFFPLRNQARFTGPLDNPSNQPYVCTCSQLIFADYDTNNTYYRSSPWRSDGFIGKANPVGFGPFDGEREDSGGANVKLLQYPTTIMDLGPRAAYTTELVLDPRYQGYVMNRLYYTSFKDVSDLIQLFFLVRLLSRTIAGIILEQLVGVVTGGVGTRTTDLIYRLFNSRGFRKVDGDYAQMVAINSQIGIKEFDPEDYLIPEPSAVPEAPNGYVYTNPSASQRNVFGVFFKEDVQLRDWLSPHRLVVSPLGNITTPDNCAFNDFPIFSQDIPIYKWNIIENRGIDYATALEDSIFGDQKNEWYTNPGSTFEAFSYQGLDRLNSDFMNPDNTSIYNYNKAYIFNVNGAGEIDPQPPLPAGNSDRIFTSSGPYYFYFGLNVGKTAYDRFIVKWIKSDFFEI